MFNNILQIFSLPHPPQSISAAEFTNLLLIFYLGWEWVRLPTSPVNPMRSS